MSKKEYVKARDINNCPITVVKCSCGAVNSLKNNCCYACGAYLK